MTLVELESAHIAARIAWVCPDDDERKDVLIENAMIACADIGVDYADGVSRYLISTGCTMDLARRQFAERLRDQADDLYASTC